MYRDRIRVRPASGRPSDANAYQSFPSSANPSVDFAARRSASAEDGHRPSSQSESSYRSESAWAPSDYAAEASSGRGWQYATRVAKLAYETVSTVFGGLRRPHDGASTTEEYTAYEQQQKRDLYGSAQRPQPLSTPAPLNTPAMPPNTPYHSADFAAGASGAVERRRPRSTEDGTYGSGDVYRPSQQVHVRDDRTAYPVGRGSGVDALAMDEDRPYRVYPPTVRGLASSVATQPQNITVNMYFPAPEVNPYPLVTAQEALAPLNSLLTAATRYQPRASLLTVPSAVRPSPRRVAKPAVAVEAVTAKPAVEKVEKPVGAATAATSAPGGFISAALAKHAPASEENSLTTPFAMVDKAKPTAAPTTAAPAANPFSFSPKPTEKTAGAPAATEAAAPPANPFSFTPAKPAAKAAPTAAPAAPQVNSFVKAGPPAVMPDDDGFASGADSDDEGTTEKGTNDTAKTAPAAKAPLFSFKPSGGATGAPFGAAPTPAASAPANPFTFSPTKPADTAAPLTKPLAFGAAKPPATATTTATTTKAAAPAAPPVNSFVKAGPPAVMPDDDGFAPGADSDDEGKDEKASVKPPSAPPAKAAPAFSFKAASTAGTTAPFGGAPASPFTFAPAKPAASAAPSASPFGAAPAKPATSAPFGATASAPVNSFVKAGPPAVMPDDDGFAPGADSDDDNGPAKATKTESAPPAKAPLFSFKPSGGATGAPFGSSTPANATAGSGVAFGFTPPATSAAPATPFKFSAAPTTGAFSSSASPFGGSGASSPSSAGQSSSFTFGKSS